MNRIWQAAGAIATALLLLASTTGAQAAGRILSVEPQAVQQGDTVLLTIRGDGLPTGNIRLEFFPQQIAVVSAALSSSPTELTAQIRVPQLATPGAYNVMVSNQFGDEAFGQALLTITSTLRTPVFKNYDPKVIARADSGFALMLTGDSLSAEAAPHLSVSWEQGGSAVGGLQSVFSYAAGSIICAVTGRLPTGILRGKVSMAGKPIYQLEVEVRGGTAVIGHAPTRIHSNAGAMSVRLIGDDLSSGWLSRAKVTLRAGRKEVPAASVALRDGATAEVSFNGPLPTGEWVIAVTVDGVGVYQGTLTVLPALPAPVTPPPAPALDEPGPGIDPLEPTDQPVIVPGTRSSLPHSDVITETVEFSAVSDVQSHVAPPTDSAGLPDNFEMTEVQVASGSAPARIRSADFTAGANGSPSRLVLAGDNLAPEMLDGLAVAITHRGGQVTPEFSSAGAGAFTFLFSIANELQDATVVAKDTLGVLPMFRERLKTVVAKAVRQTPPVAEFVAEPVAAAIPEPAVSSPAISVTIDGPVQVDSAGFALTLTGVPGGIDWSAAALTSSHPILAPNTSKFAVEAPLSGSRTLLRLRRDTDALSDAVYAVLADTLCESPTVPLRFEWADGRALECSGEFRRTAEAADEGGALESGQFLVKGSAN